MRPRGRPRKPLRDQQSRLVQVLLTEQDKLALEALAAAEGDSTAGYLRRLVLRHLKGTR